MKPSITIYTDGACRGNPGPGGWGALLIRNNEQQTICGAEAHTTNNRMELMAAIRALASLDQADTIELYTDSQYLRNGVLTWMDNWKARNWKTAGRKDVKNRDLWEELDRQISGHKIEWHWVRGHTGNPGNEKADELANQAIDSLLRRQSELISENTA